MSRIGKKPVVVPAGVQASVDGQTVKMKGAKGELSFTVSEQLALEQKGAEIFVTPKNDSKLARSLWGMSRTMIANLVEGVTKGYAHTLEIHGVGFRAAMKGKDLQLQLGFSHDIVFQIPAGVDIKIGGARQDQLVISGIDKQKVGQVAAEIRSYRKPEPYQGKGVRYQGEQIQRKEGKKK
jgi:large subunit ribosomal protein L6